MHGVSILPVMKGKTPDDWRKSLYYHYYEYSGAHTVPNHEAVADGRYKLVHYYDINHSELIDLERDPLEVKNFYKNPEYAGIIKGLEVKLQQHRTQYGVPELPEPNTEWRMDSDKLAGVIKQREEAKRLRLERMKKRQEKNKAKK